MLPADDPDALAGVFAEEAEALAQQVLVTLTPPAELAGSEGTLALTMQVDGEPVTDEAFVVLPAAAADKAVGGGEVGTAGTPVETGFAIPRGLMFGGLVIASDGGDVILRRLHDLAADDAKSARLRLAALRKALAEHTAVAADTDDRTLEDPSDNDADMR